MISWGHAALVPWLPWLTGRLVVTPSRRTNSVNLKLEWPWPSLPIWNLDHYEFIYEFGSTWIHRYEFIVYEFINYEFIVCYEFIGSEFIFMSLWIHSYEFKYFRIHSYEFIYVNSIVNSICIIMNSYLWIQVLLNS